MGHLMLSVIVRLLVSFALLLLASMLAWAIHPLIPNGWVKRQLYKPRRLIPDYSEPVPGQRSRSRAKSVCATPKA